MALSFGASFLEEEKAFVFILRGGFQVRQQVTGFEFSTRPKRQAAGDDITYMKGATLTTDTPGEDTTVIGVRAIAYSGNLWTRPLDQKQQPIHCNWLHGFVHGESELLVTPSIDGWVKMSDQTIRDVLTREFYLEI